MMDPLTQIRDRLLTAVLTGGTALRAWPGRNVHTDACKLAESLGGRSVLVTGASSGIGRAVARKVAGAGANVLLVARSEKKLAELSREIAKGGGHARVYAADLSSGASVNELLSHLDRDGVRVDVLVNNAGRSIRRAVSQSYERLHDFERTMQLNYFGSLRLILGLLPAMRERGRGHVINVSTAGVQVGTPLFSAYVASKAALDAFSRIAGVEAAEDGVHFSTVHMPLVKTPMIEPTEAFRDASALTPEEAADLVLRPLSTLEKQVGTRLGSLCHLVHVLSPELSERLVSSGHCLLRAEERATAAAPTRS